MEARMNYAKAAPGAMRAMNGLENYLASCGLEPGLMDLVRLRASQINGCAYCVDMHSLDARAGGETEQRLYALPVWQETPFFSERERAALLWTEKLTLISIEICEPKQGETVVVSAASGAVGSVVGQLAKTRGCRVVGIAGGKEKCAYVVDELGLDACIDYKTGNLSEKLLKAAPNGIDIYFDNVGGEITDTVFDHLNAFSRVALCGVVSQYNAEHPYRMRNYRAILTNRTKVQGFIVGEHAHSFPQANKELQEMVASGKLKYRESVVEGLENAPGALIGLLRGENFGKQLVKLA